MQSLQRAPNRHQSVRPQSLGERERRGDDDLYRDGLGHRHLVLRGRRECLGWQPERDEQYWIEEVMVGSALRGRTMRSDLHNFPVSTTMPIG